VPTSPRRSAGPLRRALFSLLVAGSIGPGSEAHAQAWFPISPVNSGPVIRRQAGVIVDDAGNRMVVAGGEFTDGETWALDLAGEPTWTLLNQGLPETAANVVRAIYDSHRRRMILVTHDMAVYALDLADPRSWTELVGPEDGEGPNPRSYPVVVYDSIRNRVVVYGGGPDTGTWSDVWALALGGSPGWTNITPAEPGPGARWAAVGIYDPVGDRLIIGSGRTSGGIVGDFWALPLGEGGAWAPLLPSGPQPSARYLSSATYDPTSRELLLYAGHDGSVGLGDLWGLRLDDPRAWIPYTPPPPLPVSRWSHTVVFDPTRSVLHTYGGWDGSAYRADLWGMPRPYAASSPWIFGFTPPGGRVGDEVTILGLGLVDPLAVTIGDVAATILGANYSSIRALVPPGAGTGPITVTTGEGTAVSEKSFFVGELPELTGVLPDSARSGEVVELRGRHLATTTKVAFGGAGAAAFAVLSDSALAVTLDTLAASGPITVTTLVGSSTSPFEFLVMPDDPRPRLVSVRDVANDQGGRVLLRWRASDFDQPRYRKITGYRVWRRAPLEGVTAGIAAANGWKSNRELKLAAGSPAFWENIAELPASFLRGYAHTAATLGDSTELAQPATAFFVQAITADAFTFYNSSPDSGWSVDNLAPPTPTRVTVHYGPAANTLHWDAREVADLGGYRIHRGADAFFVPSASNLVVTTRDTVHADVPGSCYYKLAAVDIHGNLSRFIAVSPDRPVATLVRFFGSQRAPGAARVKWFSGGNPDLGARVYRRTAGADWARVGETFADGLGYLTWDDRDVADDSRYGYRLGVLEPGNLEIFFAETWVDPLAVELAFAGRVVNPSPGGRIACTFAVPFGSHAEIRLYDIAGREHERHTLEGGASVERSVRFGEKSRLRAGVYLIQATAAGRVVTRRVVVLD
jgi:hypothetical protein